jgi:FkbM family methyltransferase
LSSRFARLGARAAELHPYIWRLAWATVRRFPFLLPHDKSYNALRHFIALKPGGLFLDVGANDGISALSFRRFDKDYRILSLEPNRLLEPSLEKIKAGDPRFDYLIVGAGSKSSHVRFHVPVYNGIVLHTFTSRSLEHAQSSLAKTFGGSVAAAATIDAVEGKIVCVDDLKVEPAIIKIDAEGFNYDVLLGAVETIERSRPFLMVEIEVEEVDKMKNYFEERRYRLVGYDVASDQFNAAAAATRHIGRSGERNFFAIPDEMLSKLPYASAPRTNS